MTTLPERPILPLRPVPRSAAASECRPPALDRCPPSRRARSPHRCGPRRSANGAGSRRERRANRVQGQGCTLVASVTKSRSPVRSSPGRESHSLPPQRPDRLFRLRASVTSVTTELYGCTMRRSSGLVLVLVTMLSLAAPAWAGIQRDCEQTQNPNLQIQSCTAVIESGRWRGKNLAWAYNNVCVRSARPCGFSDT